LLEPSEIKQAEFGGDNTARLGLQEEAKGLPFGTVWDEFCRRNDAPLGNEWLREVRDYEKRVLGQR
jgi:L-rhamnose isomerase